MQGMWPVDCCVFRHRVEGETIELLKSKTTNVFDGLNEIMICVFGPPFIAKPNAVGAGCKWRSALGDGGVPRHFC
jgi:hypothetical protein